jgi:probable HAF family extracellular repeat protein
MLRKDLGGGFIVTSAPVASALTGGSNISPGIDYAKLIKKDWFTWYNLQFYNGFGDVLGGAYGSPDYEAVLEANRGVSPRKFVVGVPTNPDSAGANYHALSALAPKFEELARKYPHFGGVYGWTYQEAQVEGHLDPVGWTRGVAQALGIVKRPPSSGPGQTNEGAVSPASAPLYTFLVLGGSPGMATAVNARGDAVGWTYDAGLAFIVPSGGEMRSLGTFPNGHGSQAAAINSGGDTVGLAVYEDFDVGAFLVPSGQAMTDLGGLLGGRDGAALAINDSGSIAGWAYTAGDSPQPHAFLRSPAGAVQDLGVLPGGISSHATAVNGAGNIAGGALDSAGTLRAFHLERAGDTLSPLPFKGGVGASQAAALGASGMTAGWAVLPEGFDAFVFDPHGWNPDMQIDLFGTRIGSQAAATGINDHDQVVGWYLDGEGRCRAFLLPGGFGSTPLDLDDLVENPPPGDRLMIATGINRGGQIVGQTLGGRPFMLTPKP